MDSNAYVNLVIRLRLTMKRHELKLGETMSDKTRQFNGYSLFDDIEEAFLRNQNRAQVLYNMLDSATWKENNAKDTAELIQYMDLVPDEDKADVYSNLISLVSRMELH